MFLTLKTWFKGLHMESATLQDKLVLPNLIDRGPSIERQKENFMNMVVTLIP
jgi:hypothetical protein